MEHHSLQPAAQERLLLGWNLEQRQRIDDSLRATMVNGEITNQRSWVLAFLHRCVMRLLWLIPAITDFFAYQAFGDHFRFRDCANGCFISSNGGGRKLPQIWIRKPGSSPQLSDDVLFRQKSMFAMLVISKRQGPIALDVVADLIANAGFPPKILSTDSVTFLLDSLQQSETGDQEISEAEFYHPCSIKELEATGITPINGYDEKTLMRRVGSSAKFVILRPDFFIHSIAATPTEFQQNAKVLLETLLQA